MAETWKCWTVVKTQRLFVTLRCECGATREMRLSTWLAKQHVSACCKACALTEARQRMQKFIRQLEVT